MLSDDPPDPVLHAEGQALLASALPISQAADVLRQTIGIGTDVMQGASVALALVRAGVLYFVTEPLVPSTATWETMARLQAPGPETALSGSTAPDPTELVVGLRVGEDVVGFLIARRAVGFSTTEQWLLRITGQRLASAIENGRLRSHLHELLDEYMSPEVAQTLLRDGATAQLGGQTVDVTVLFADLRGFTALAERLEPAAVVTLLNRYFALATPAIVENGGTVSAFIGDAVMGLFGAPLAQPEHPLLAAKAALTIQKGIADLVAHDPDLPRFRIGIATGPATVGNLGSPRRRAFTAIGDTVNLAARLETVAEPGSIVISQETYATIRAFARVRGLDHLVVKGKAAPVTAYELLGLREGSDELVGLRTMTIRPDGR